MTLERNALQTCSTLYGNAALPCHYTVLPTANIGNSASVATRRPVEVASLVVLYEDSEHAALTAIAVDSERLARGYSL